MMPPASYQPHEILVAPARPSRALWRLVLGFLLAGAAYLALAQVFFQTATSRAVPDHESSALPERQR